MDKAKLKVLQFSIASSMGGRTRYILENWKYIDHEKFQFDFVTFSKDIAVENELIQQGCKVHHFPCYPKENEELFIAAWNKILDEGYDIVHLNTSYWDGFLLEECAYKKGVKKIIVHSHNTGVGKQLSDEEREKIVRNHFELQKTLDFNKITEFWACSKAASKWLFGERINENKIFITYPTICARDYIFDEQKRNECRTTLGIGNEFLIGTVGRIVYQKNHGFLLEIFAHAFKHDKNVKLLIIGRGELEADLRSLAVELGVVDQLIIVNSCEDIVPYYHAMDLFVLPSLYEGFPKVVLEAAASGLRCLCSNTITDEIEFSDLIKRIPLEKTLWEKEFSCSMKRTECNRKHAIDLLLQSGFDLTKEIRRIEKKYMEN
ncbi:MAG: glycosyltransferase family 1 protein [Lachnospiraceae bacterium]|nr:glycosyltransferase family 1 protein [Lachnospiraceae bacterium]